MKKLNATATITAVGLRHKDRNASRADIRVEYSSAPFGARTKTFSGVSSLSSTQLLDGLSTEVAYTADVSTATDAAEAVVQRRAAV